MFDLKFYAIICKMYFNYLNEFQVTYILNRGVNYDNYEEEPDFFNDDNVRYMKQLIKYFNITRNSRLRFINTSNEFLQVTGI